MCENPPKRIDEKVQKPRLIGSVVSRKPTPTLPTKNDGFDFGSSIFVVVPE